MSYTDIQKQVLNLNISLDFIKKILKKLENRAIYLQTKKELSAMSDRELSDIGISRSQIDYVAKGGKIND